MRTFDDIKTIRFDTQGSIKLDLERVYEDPAWNAVTGDLSIETEDDLNAALVKYFQFYFANEIIFKEVPSTCGPADIYSVRARVHERRKKETNEPSSPGAPSGQDQQPALR
jgi:hypothetical protein